MKLLVLHPYKSGGDSIIWILHYIYIIGVLARMGVQSVCLHYYTYLCITQVRVNAERKYCPRASEIQSDECNSCIRSFNLFISHFYLLRA